MSMRDSIVAARMSGPDHQGPGEAVFEFRFGKDDPTFAGHFLRILCCPEFFKWK